MANEGTAGSREKAHPLVERVLDSQPPIARPIGFDVQKIGDGHAVGFMKSGPQHANPLATQSALPAEAQVTNRGKNVGCVECEVKDRDGKLVARANSTGFVLRGEHAKQR